MIGIDAGNSLDRPPTGVAVYARNVTRELALGHPEQRFGWYYRSNRYLRSFRTRLPSNVSRRLLEETALRLRPGRPTLFHGLNQRLPKSMDTLKVVTFHDLFAITGEYSTPDFRERFAELARETASRADHIIAVSAHTADQVAELLGFPRTRISVVHHGAEPLITPGSGQCDAIMRRLAVNRPFLLHVGSLQVRKNVARLVEAFETVEEPVDLVLAGARGYGADRIVERIRNSPARDRIHLVGHVADEVRACLYARAEALVFPSLEEGFGLPVIEAFAAGLPVIASNVSALPEVAGGAAMLVDPLRPPEITEAIGCVLGNSVLRADLRSKGAARVQGVTWQRCARETWKVYELLGAGSVS